MNRAEDPTDRTFHALLARIKHVKHDAESLEQLRRSVNAFRRYVVARKARFAFGPEQRPVFTAKPTIVSFEKLLEDARRDQAKRLKANPALLKVLRVRPKK
jgi:hypothetical protein